VKYFTLASLTRAYPQVAGLLSGVVRMADREMTKRDRAAAMARLDAENARWLAAELAGDVTELQGARRDRRRDGAVDPAHRLLVGTLPQE
jgi:hypothetical protein